MVKKASLTQDIRTLKETPFDDALPIRQQNGNNVASFGMCAGYRARHAGSSDQALALLKEGSPDLLLLDVDLPGFSGLKLLEALKENDRTAGIPVIMLTVYADQAHKIQGLKKGADDYLVKPFAPGELIARVEALLRRTRNAGRIKNVLEAEGLSLDIEARQAALGAKRLVLTGAEFDLLALLLQNRGSVLSNQALAQALSRGPGGPGAPGSSGDSTSGSVYTHVKNLRTKLGPAGKLIETVYSFGYRFSG